MKSETTSLDEAIVPAVTLSIAEMKERWAKLPRLGAEDAMLFEEVLRDICQNSSLPDSPWN